MNTALGTGKLISNSGLFPCLLLSAERQAHGPLVLAVASFGQVCSRCPAIFTAGFQPPGAKPVAFDRQIDWVYYFLR
jgi:hypothetical protein